MAFKTPGVYVKEISLFPPSVAEVATAVPAFIGYTQKAEQKGGDLTNVPTKIRSLLDYRELFGGGYDITGIDVVVDETNSYAVESLSIGKRFYMYDALRLFFDNGGGSCYIVSVGSYSDTVANGDPATAGSKGLSVGLTALEKYDEPTIILFPDAPLLAAEIDLYTLQQRALAQCAKLQDRVGVFDLLEEAKGGRSLQESVDEFRNNIGINNLKYGAAYTPWLHSAYPMDVDFGIFRDTVYDDAAKGAGDKVDLTTVTSDDKVNALVTTANTAIADIATLKGKLTALKAGKPSLQDQYASLRNALKAATDASPLPEFGSLMAFVRGVAVDVPTWKTALKGANLLRDLDAYAKDKLKSAVGDLIAMEKNADVLAVIGGGRDASDVEEDYAGAGGDAVYEPTEWLISFDTDDDDLAVDDIAASADDYSNGGALTDLPTALAAAKDLDTLWADIAAFIADVEAASAVHDDMAQKTLYDGHAIIGNIVEKIKLELSRTPPSGAIAGVYAFVDNTRGVWKAPANVSVSAVLGPAEPIDFFDQEELNVDVTAGKSINAIRTFTGRGTIVWGARTLAGNDNEWRYVPVRRFFNMVEESVKKSTAWAVFEPNSAPLWMRVKSMIENYLIQKWREGALAGATPDAAFFVKVGLGETMTAQDILEGRLIVEIGMAVVRPAEFIILKFSHKMQES